MSYTDFWKRPHSSHESREQALIRIYNDPKWREDVGKKGYLLHLAALFDTTKMAVNKKLGRLRKAKIIKHFQIDDFYDNRRLITIDKRFPKANLPKKFLELIMEANALRNERDLRQEIVNPEYLTDKYVGLVFGGDWHFEHYRVNIKSLLEDLALIGKEPELFYVFNGDISDNIFLRFIDLENETINIPIRYTYEVIQYLFSKIPNTLAVVMGCHDNWVRTRARFDISDMISQVIMGYYLGYGGTINFKVGKVTYRIGVFHKYGAESQTNHFHPNYKYLIRQDADADIVAIAHRHDIVGISHVFVQGRDRVLVRSGSEQYRTEYAWKEGFRGAIAEYPMVILSGSERRMILGARFREGVPILRGLNAGTIDPKQFDKKEIPHLKPL